MHAKCSGFLILVVNATVTLGIDDRDYIIDFIFYESYRRK